MHNAAFDCELKTERQIKPIDAHTNPKNYKVELRTIQGTLQVKYFELIVRLMAVVLP